MARIAVGGRVPVFAVAGTGMRSAVQDLRLAGGVELVDSPRAAAILLVAGPFDPVHTEALARTHDLLAHPRATLAWGTIDPFAAMGGPSAASVDAAADPVAALRGLFLDLLSRRRPSEEPLLPDVDPVEWRGIGPYGQGGSGMTGGTPYGRPMPELAPDRDGLRLDVLSVALGPFFPRLPAPLVLDLRVAGDVILEAGVADAAVGDAAASRVADAAGPRTAGAALRPPSSPFVRALFEPVPVAELELTRARDHLLWLSDGLYAHGLPGFGLRVLRLAHDARAGDGARVRRLGQALRRTGLFRWSVPAGPPIPVDALAGQGLGPVARSAGLAEDARTEDPAYRALEFAPFVIDRNDPVGRWQVRLEEAARSLDLAGRADKRRSTPIGRVEGPRGVLAPGDSPTARALGLVPGILPGLEWGDAIATLISLDLDLDEAGAVSSLRSMLATA